MASPDGRGGLDGLLVLRGVPGDALAERVALVGVRAVLVLERLAALLRVAALGVALLGGVLALLGLLGVLGVLLARSALAFCEAPLPKALLLWEFVP